MEGFIVFDYASQYAHARTDLAAWLSEGKIQRKETIVQGGLTTAGEALVSLYKGSNTGMCVVVRLLVVNSFFASMRGFADE